ncbi:MAG: hypothetical protein GY841_06740 [FCB group bacterium]|nr:hypothetical protein [FCB group bacterium]
MCKFKTLWMSLIIILCLLTTPGWGQFSEFLGPFAAKWELVSTNLEIGENPVKLIAVIRWQYDSLSVRILPLGKINCINDTTWNIVANKGDSLEYILPITLPPGDTVGVDALFAKDGKHLFSADIWFVTTGDTVETYPQKPKPPPPPPPPHYGIPDSLHPMHTRKLSPQYDTLTSKNTGIVTDDEKQRILESKPLLNADVQVMRFNGEDWMRRRGEYKFHRIKTTVDPIFNSDTIPNIIDSIYNDSSGGSDSMDEKYR